MHTRFLGLAGAALVMMAVVLVGTGEAQPPFKKGKAAFGKAGFGRTITADDIVTRLMSFDKNNDGKVVADELPERMQHLIALGDANKDGALDKEEVRKLADTLESFVNLVGPVGPGGLKGGGKGGGFKGAAPKGLAFKGGAEVQRTLDDLDLSALTRDRADRLLRAHQAKLRGLEELARAELVLEMKNVLKEDDYKIFKAALDRPIGPQSGSVILTTDLTGRIDRLQKDLEALRGKLPK